MEKQETRYLKADNNKIISEAHITWVKKWTNV